MEWYEDLIPYLKTSCSNRLWFCENHLLKNPILFCELLLECPAPDVRLAFSKIIVFVAHYALIDKNDPTKGKLIAAYALTWNIIDFD